MARPTSPAPLHLPGTESANLVETPKFKELSLGLQTIKDSGGLILVDGPPGTGKTFASDVIYQHLHIESHWVSMPYQPRGKETTARIYETLTGSRVDMRSNTEFELLRAITDFMKGNHLLLVIDEAQHLTKGPLNQLRFLFDRRDTTLVLLLVGAGLSASVQRNCEPLLNRIEKRVIFRRKSPKDMALFLRDYHAMFANSDADAVRTIIGACGGSIRTAATLLKAGLDILPHPEKGITQKEARSLIRLVQGVAA